MQVKDPPLSRVSRLYDVYGSFSDILFVVRPTLRAGQVEIVQRGLEAVNAFGVLGKGVEILPESWPPRCWICHVFASFLPHAQSYISFRLQNENERWTAQVCGDGAPADSDGPKQAFWVLSCFFSREHRLKYSTTSSTWPNCRRCTIPNGQTRWTVPAQRKTLSYGGRTTASWGLL